MLDLQVTYLSSRTLYCLAVLYGRPTESVIDMKRATTSQSGRQHHGSLQGNAQALTGRATPAVTAFNQRQSTKCTIYNYEPGEPGSLIDD